MAEPNTAADPSKPSSPKAHQNPSNPTSSFLYKLILVSVIIALLPIFPSSHSPDSSNKPILARGWELLHLLLVGIAISYGLFSRRNPDPEIEKETLLKADTPQSYVSQILRVSPVFDEEEIGSPKGPATQTWNYSQYHGEEPVIMVAKESSTKPLVLPVRSLKSLSHNMEPFDSGYEVKEPSFEATKKDEVVVLPSPIPWRSRSGKMELKQESSPPLGSPRSSSFEIRGKINEDFMTKKNNQLEAQTDPVFLNPLNQAETQFYKSSPPPPPPPPPPPLSHAPHFNSQKRDAKKSFKNELEDLSRKGSAGSDSNKSEDSYIVRSVRRVRSKNSQKRNKFMEKMIITSESETESRDSGLLSESDADETSNSASTEEAAPEENEVDKKADEFIAKFREQIRLQRIASIKKSTTPRSTRNSK